MIHRACFLLSYLSSLSLFASHVDTRAWPPHYVNVAGYVWDACKRRTRPRRRAATNLAIFHRETIGFAGPSGQCCQTGRRSPTRRISTLSDRFSSGRRSSADVRSSIPNAWCSPDFCFERCAWLTWWITRAAILGSGPLNDVHYANLCLASFFSWSRFFTLFLIYSSLTLVRLDARVFGFRQGNGVYYVFQIFFLLSDTFIFVWLVDGSNRWITCCKIYLYFMSFFN